MSPPEAANITHLLLARYSAIHLLVTTVAHVALHFFWSIVLFLEVFFHKTLIFGGFWEFSLGEFVDIGWFFELAEVCTTALSG